MHAWYFTSKYRFLCSSVFTCKFIFHGRTAKRQKHHRHGRGGHHEILRPQQTTSLGISIRDTKRDRMVTDGSLDGPATLQARWQQFRRLVPAIWGMHNISWIMYMYLHSITGIMRISCACMYTMLNIWENVELRNPQSLSGWIQMDVKRNGA